MRNQVRKVLLVWVSGLVALMLVVGCSGGTQPGTTTQANPAAAAQKEIVVSISADLTGPTATGSKYMYRAEMNYINMLNEKGGIDGVRIKPVWADSKFDVKQILTNWKTFEEAKSVVHFSTGSAENSSLKDKWQELKMPVVTMAISGYMLHPQPSTIYSYGANYIEWTGAFLEWAKADWKAKGNTSRPRVGAVIWQNASTQETIDGMPLYAAGAGVDWGPMELVPADIGDAKALVQRLNQAGVNYVWTQLNLPSWTKLFKDAAAVGLLDKMAWGTAGYYADLIKAAPKEAEGVYMVERMANFSEDVPGMRTIKDIQLKYNGEIVEDTWYLYGWLNATVGFEAVRIALKDVGYEKISSAAVLAAFPKIKNLDTGGVTPALTYTDPNEREGAWSAKVARVKDGKITPVGDWITGQHVGFVNGKLTPLP